MATTITIGDKTYRMRPRSLRLELELSEDGGPKDELRKLAREGLRLQTRTATAIKALDAIDGDDHDALDAILTDVEALEADRLRMDHETLRQTLRVAAIVLRDEDGNPPSLDALEDVDMGAIAEVIAEVNGARPTQGTSRP